MNAPVSIGRDGASEHSVFAVPGLRCAGCIATLEQGLAPLPGVLAARVNFTSRQLAVDHDPELRLPDLRAAIARLGFEAEPVSAAALATHQETRALAKAGGNKKAAALMLGLSRRALYRRLERLDLAGSISRRREPELAGVGE